MWGDWDVQLQRPPTDFQALDLKSVCQTLPQELIWHGIKPVFLLLMHSLCTFKYCILQACVESQPVFTAETIKEAHLKYSLWERDRGNYVIHPDSQSPYRRYTVCLGCNLHMVSLWNLACKWH